MLILYLILNIINIIFNNIYKSFHMVFYYYLYFQYVMIFAHMLTQGTYLRKGMVRAVFPVRRGRRASCWTTDGRAGYMPYCLECTA